MYNGIFGITYRVVKGLNITNLPPPPPPTHTHTKKCILVVNAPIWFSAIWSIVRVFVNERTQSKVSISSSRSSLAALSKHLDYEEIPEKYGGGKRCRNGEGGKDNGRWWSEEEIRFRHWVEVHGGVKHDQGDKERMERRVE